MTPIDALFVFAVLCGCLSAWKGSRTGWALLGSAAVSSLFIWAGMEFNIAVWLLIDIVVIAAITCRPMNLTDVCIVASFIPVWALYAVPDPAVPDAISLIVSTQLLLSTPWRWVFRKATRKAPRPVGESDFYRVAHAGRE